VQTTRKFLQSGGLGPRGKTKQGRAEGGGRICIDELWYTNSEGSTTRYVRMVFGKGGEEDRQQGMGLRPHGETKERLERRWRKGGLCCRGARTFILLGGGHSAPTFLGKIGFIIRNLHRKGRFNLWKGDDELQQLDI